VTWDNRDETVKTLPSRRRSEERNLAGADLLLLADQPLAEGERDRLGFGVYTEALASLIDDPNTDTPLTIAISAPWGAGKTSLAKMVEARLKDLRGRAGEPQHIFCWFHAWLHDDAPHLGAAFAADVARTISPRRPLYRRLAAPLPTAMLNPAQRWRRRLEIAGLALLPAAAVATAVVVVDSLRHLLESKLGLPKTEGASGALASTWIGLLALFAGWSKIRGAAQSAVAFIDNPGSEAARGSMAEVREQLRKLIEEATLGGQRRLVIFVDDLERCRPPRGIEICEVASQLLGHTHVITVLLGDMDVVAASAQQRYAGIEEAALARQDKASLERISEYGRLYLEKIVQIQFDLPAARHERIRSMLLSNHDGREVKEGSSDTAETTATPTGAVFVDPTQLAIFAGVAATMVVTIIPALGLFPDWLFVALLSVTAGIVPFSIGLVGSRRTAQKRQKVERIDKEVRQNIEAGVDDVAELEEKVLHSEALRGQDQGLVLERARRQTTESDLRKAEEELMKYVPALPRKVKRMVNHLRLLLRMAAAQRQLGEQSGPSPLHLAKWLVLQERWPLLCRAVELDPRVLAKLERAAESRNLFTAALKDAEISTAPSPELLRFLRSRPRIGRRARELVFL
jgi:hypothetical protein